MTSWVSARSSGGASREPRRTRSARRRGSAPRAGSRASATTARPRSRSRARPRRRTVASRPVDRGAQVRVLELEAVERGPLAVAVERRRQLLGERQVGAGVALAGSRRRRPRPRAAPARTRGSARASRTAARRRPRRCARGSGPRATPGRRARRRRGPRPGRRRPPRRGRSKPPMNTRQPLEQAAVGRVEQVVAPHDRAAQRPLALRDVGRARARQVEPALEPLVDRGRREEPDPRGGQLDGERHAAEVGDDRGDVAGVGAGDRESRLGPSSRGRRTAGPTRTRRAPPGRAPGSRRAAARVRAARGGRGRAGRAGPGPGTPARRRSAAGPGSWRGSGSGPRGAAAPRGRSRRRAPARGCRGPATARFGSSSVARTSIGLRDGSSPTPIARAIARDDEVRVRDAAQRHEPGAVRVLVGEAGRDLEREARLAGAARARSA